MWVMKNVHYTTSPWVWLVKQAVLSEPSCTGDFSLLKSHHLSVIFHLLFLQVMPDMPVGGNKLQSESLIQSICSKPLFQEQRNNIQSLMCKSLNYSLKLFHKHWFIKEFLLLIWTHLPYILFMIMAGSHIKFSSSSVYHWAFYFIWATVLSIIIQKKLSKFPFFVLNKS